MSTFAPYVAQDRLRAMARGEAPPDRDAGSALFADVCGFTAYGEALVTELGEREGAERLAAELAAIYGLVLPVIQARGGSVVGFNGDAVTCFFPGDSGRVAVSAAHAMQASLRAREGGLPLKVAIAAGAVRRFAAGAPEVQLLDVLAGETMLRMAAAEGRARESEVVVAPEVIEALGADAKIAERRGPFAVLRPGAAVDVAAGTVDVPEWPLGADAARPWLLPAVHERLVSGQGDFFAEFRRVTAMFLAFEGLDFDSDDRVGEKLDAFVREVQRILLAHGGHLIKLSAGDKGSHFLATFGAPVAHDDGMRHALAAALDLLSLGSAFDYVRGIRIGIGHGRMLTGAFGSRRRRAYDVLGAEANIAARLMQAAAPGEAWVTPRVREACSDFDFGDRGLVKLKGRVPPLAAAAVVGRSSGRARAHATRPSGAPASEPRPAILGRDEERARLEVLLRRFADEGEGGPIVIEGDAGIGKSRLAEELREVATSLGLRVLDSAGDSIEQHAPYGALRAPFEEVLRGGAREPLDAAALEERITALLPGDADRELVPLVSAVVPVDAPDSDRTARMVGSARADSTADLLARLLASYALAGRAVLLVEDAHWLDSASLRVLLRVRRSVRDVLLVIVTRPRPHADPDGRWETLERFGRGDGGVRLVLPPLAERHAVALACARLGVAALPESLAKLVAETAGGHPLFSQELVVALRDRGSLTVQGGRCRVEGDAAALRLGDLFDSVEEAITSRIDGLGPAEQLALKVASVIGREFSLAALKSVHPVAADRERLAELLEAATLLGIAAARRGDGEPSYAFRHAITHEVVYALLPTGQRRELHRAVGELVERESIADAPRSYPLLAHHFGRAAAREKAALYLDRAGEQARRAHANREAVRFFAEALSHDAESRAAAPATRARWHRHAGEALSDLGRFAESREHFVASARSLGLPEPGKGARLVASLGKGALRQMLHRHAPGSLRPGKTTSAAERFEATRVDLGLAKLHFYQNEGPELVDASLRALNQAELGGLDAECGLASSAIGVVAGVVPLRGLAGTYCRLAVEAASRAGDEGILARVLLTIAVYDVGTGDWPIAFERTRRARQLFERLGDVRQWEETLAVELPAALHAGPLEDAEQLVERLHASATSREDPHTLAWGLLGLIEVALRRGERTRLERALACVEEVEALFDTNLGPMEELRVHGLAGLVRLRLGDLAGAEASADRGLGLVHKTRPASPHTLDGQAAIAATFLGLLQQDGAAAQDRFRGRAKASVAALRGYARVFPIAEPRAHLATGQLLRASGSRRRAARAFRAALRAAEALGIPYDAELARQQLQRLVQPFHSQPPKAAL